MPHPPDSLGASCSLDRARLEAQLDRYRGLAASVEAVERTGRSMRVRFAQEVAWDVLEAAVAVERRCCPFFAIATDAETRVVRVAVDDADHVPALDAIAHSLGVAAT